MREIRSVLKNCTICNREYRVSFSDLKHSSQKYCSHKCYWKDMVGRKLPQATIKKMIGRQVGEKHHMWKGGISKDKSHLKFLWKRNHTKPLLKMYNRTYRHRHRKAGKLALKTVQMLYENNIKEYGTLTCIYCLKPIPFGKDSLEHKIPISRGGTNEYCNLGVACRNCNSRKGNKIEEEYRKCL